MTPTVSPLFNLNNEPLIKLHKKEHKRHEVPAALVSSHCLLYHTQDLVLNQGAHGLGGQRSSVLSMRRSMAHTPIPRPFTAALGWDGRILIHHLSICTRLRGQQQTWEEARGEGALPAYQQASFRHTEMLTNLYLMATLIPLSRCTAMSYK